MIRYGNNIPINFTTRGVNRVSGTTTETILSSVSISGGTFKSGDVVFIEGMFDSKTITLGITTKMYVNTGSTIAGATQIMSRGLSAGDTWQIQERVLHIVRGDGSMTGTTPDRGTIFAASGTANVTDFRSTTDSIASIDWTTNKVIFFTGTLNSAAAGNYINQYFMKVWTY
jgi:hypothetical protein